MIKITNFRGNFDTDLLLIFMNTIHFNIDSIIIYFIIRIMIKYHILMYLIFYFNNLQINSL